MHAASILLILFFYLQNLDTIKKNKLKCVEVLELVGKLEGFNAKYFIVRQKTGNRFGKRHRFK